ncbi:MAG: hypothetical protein H6713_38945 [Myxococcales bacterium]|nr:hypothetical protein [Myxococcales bacterium]
MDYQRRRRRPRAAGAMIPLALALACGDSEQGTQGTTAGGSTGAATETSGGVTGGAATTTGGATTAGVTTASTTASTSTSDGTGSTASSVGETETSTGGQDCDGEIVTFETGKSPAVELHLAPDGVDAGDCGDPQSPCQSLEYAAALAGPGAAIRLHAGTYGGGAFLNDLQGDAGAPIWIGGAPGEPRPVISGGAEALHLTRARYLIVHDLEVTGQTGNGINADDGGDYGDPDATRHLVFRDLHIHDVGDGGNQDCLKLSGLDDYFVLDSEFSACGGGGQGSGVDHVGCHHGLLARNNFHDMGGNAIQCKGGADDIEIRQSRFDEVGERGVNMGGSTGDEFFRPPLSTQSPNFEARDIRVIANEFRGSNAALAFVGCVDCLAANNTIDTPHNWVLRILQEKTSTPEHEFLPASGGRLVNNLIYFDRGDLSTYVNIGPNTDAPSFSFTTNLWYAYDAPGQSNPGGDLPAPEQGGIYGVDPLLGDPGGGDYSIDLASPAAGAGTTIDELTRDVVDVCYLDPPAIGARERPE